MCDINLVTIGSQVEIHFQNENLWKRGTVAEILKPNDTFKIKMKDDADMPTYTLDLYEWRFSSNIQNSNPRDIYEVESIIDKKYENGSVLYRVKWKNFPEEDSTWEPLAHLKSATNLVMEYDTKEAVGKRPREVLPEQPRKRPRIQTEERLEKPKTFYWPTLPAGTNLDINQCHNWSEQDVSQWLNIFDFAETYRKKFLDNAVDGRLLLELTCLTLFQVLGISDKSHQQKFETAITVLKRARQFKYGQKKILSF